MAETVIIKEAAIKAVKDAFEYPEYYELAIELAVDAIKEIPEIEAKPVIHAHWEDRSWAGIVCSNCQENALENGGGYDVLSKYCPFCGAQMDEEVDK